MPLLRNVGKRIGRGAGRVAKNRWTRRAGVAGGLAVGVPAAALYSTLNNQDPRETPFTDYLMEAVTGDAQMDRKIIGADISMGDIYGYPGHTAIGQRLRLLNPGITKFADIRQARIDRTRDLATKNVDQGYTRYPYPNTSMPYRASTTRRLNASGDIVLGLHNGR